MSVLIKAKQDADSNGRTLVLGRPTEQVHRVFALVGLADWLAFDGLTPAASRFTGRRV